MESIRFKLNGLVPLMMHNGRLANPFDPFAIAIKAVTSKRKKTEEDSMVIFWNEWCGGLYTDGKILPSTCGESIVKPIIPAANLLSFINDGARNFKRGQDVLRAVQFVGEKGEYAFLENTGWPNKPLKEIHTIGDFTDVRAIVSPSTGGRTMRCRPIFHKWKIEFLVAYDTEILNRSDMITFVKRAAQYNGIGDNKPSLGRCEVTVMEETK